MKRFLFLFSDTGGGHRASAQAVCDELYRLYGDAVQVTMIDFFKAIERWPFQYFPELYPAMVGLHGIPWKVGYRLTDKHRRVKTLSRLIWPYTGHSLYRVVRQHTPDVIVSFHAVPNYILERIRRRMDGDISLATVVLDLVSIHAAWFTPGYDLYIVPTAEAQQRALQCGVIPERIQVVGMPVRRCFVGVRDLPQRAARAQLGLPQQGPIVLLVGGGDGIGPLKPVVQAVAAQHPAAHLVVIAGRNAELRRELCALETQVPLLQVEGFVSNMEVWMRAADLLVSKAGPNTLSEAFITGCPIIIYSAIPGQETGNVAYVVKHNAGLWAPSPEATAQAIIELLTHPARRQAMADNSRALARPQAATTIAQSLWNLSQAQSTPYAGRWVSTPSKWSSAL